jgi:hypothetical protein
VVVGRARKQAGAIVAAMLCIGQVSAQPAANSVPPAQPVTAAQPEGPCANVALERVRLESERAQIDRTIDDIAMGRHGRKPKKVSGGDVAQGVAGTAASILLPFGVGALLSAGASAAIKSGKKKGAKPAPPGPDVEGMLEREREIGQRLDELKACPG